MNDRSRLVESFEHAVTVGENGLPVVWVVPAGTKAEGHSDHWVAVEVGADAVCSCGLLMYPGPVYEPYLLRAIAEHFAEVSA